MKKENYGERATKGGLARAEALTPEKRKEIARNAALARWGDDVPIAAYEGKIPLGEQEVDCAVLPNSKRIITQAAFLRALGRSRSPKAGTGVLSTVDGKPFFLAAEALKPFIDDDLLASTTPIFYRAKNGSRGVGYDALLLPKVAEVYLRFRDHLLEKARKVPAQYEHIIAAADLLIRGLAHVGIIALIDEVTGYQKDRAKNALAEILEEFIAKELRPWVRTFPHDFYDQLFRLRGLSYPSDSVRRPQYFGHLTNDIVYARIAPYVLEELKKQVPRAENGRLKHHLHRKLTEEVGHPKLKEHLASVVSLMKISDNFEQFMGFLNRAHPRYNETIPLPLNVESGL